MARKFLTPLDLVQNELQNARIQNLGTAPTSPAPVKGQMYFNTGDNTLYWYDGSGWISSRGGGTGFPGFGSSTAQTTFGQAKSDGVGGTSARADHTHGTPTHDQAAHAGMSAAPSGAAGGDLSGTYPNPQIAAGVITDADVNAANKDGAVGTASMRTLGNSAGQAKPGNQDFGSMSQNNPPTTNVNMNGWFINNLQDPQTAQQAATKAYVDSVAQGLSAKQHVEAATTGPLGGGTFTPGGPQTVDGFATTNGERVLVKNQTNQQYNGIYITNSGGSWSRATDADTGAELVSAYVWVEEGTINKDTGWVCTVDDGAVMDTTPLPWAQFSGAGTILAGQGLQQSGNSIMVGNGAGIGADADYVFVNWAGTGSANTSARSDHNHDTAYPPVARTIATTAPLTGGGDLSANRTLAITSFAGSAAGAVPASAGGTANFLRADGTWNAPVPGIDQTTADGRYVNVTGGDTMAGTLTITGGGTSISAAGGAINAANVVLTNMLTAVNLQLSGAGATLMVSGTSSAVDFSGVVQQVLLPAITPTLGGHAATKTYVDAQVATAGKRFAGNVGGSTAVTVSHNLGTRDVAVDVYRNSAPYDSVDCDVERTDTNTVTLRFTVAPAAAEYRAVVVA